MKLGKQNPVVPVSPPRFWPICSPTKPITLGPGPTRQLRSGCRRGCIIPATSKLAWSSAGPQAPLSSIGGNRMARTKPATWISRLGWADGPELIRSRLSRGTRKTWVLSSGSQLRPGPPLDCRSAQGQAELAESETKRMRPIRADGIKPTTQCLRVTFMRFSALPSTLQTLASPTRR